MNREIKFRGKDLLGKWRYGDLVQEKWKSKLNTNEKVFMIKNGNRATTVLENTVGQFTGLHDKNGKEIYEGDIIKITENTLKHKIIQMKPIIAEIVWSEEYLTYILITLSIKDAFESLADYLDEYDIEVIGNIYENKELLGGCELLEILAKKQ